MSHNNTAYADIAHADKSSALTDSKSSSNPRYSFYDNLEFNISNSNYLENNASGKITEVSVVKSSLRQETTYGVKSKPKAHSDLSIRLLTPDTRTSAKSNHVSDKKVVRFDNTANISNKEQATCAQYSLNPATDNRSQEPELTYIAAGIDRELDSCFHKEQNGMNTICQCVGIEEVHSDDSTCAGAVKTSDFVALSESEIKELQHSDDAGGLILQNINWVS